MRRAIIFTAAGVVLAAIVFMGMLVPACREVRRSRAHAHSAVAEAGADQFRLACRDLVERHKVPAWRYQELDLKVVTLPEPLTSLPIRKVIVMHDCVEIWLDDPGRAGILCFTAGAHEYGSAMITNGIWFWTGTPSGTTRGYYDEWVRRNREETL